MTFILALAFDEKLTRFFEQQRGLYYPNHLNQTPAHGCVFHQLPEEHFRQIDQRLKQLSSNTLAIECKITAIQFLGRGNAYALNFEQDVFQQLRAEWWNWLIPQDKQNWHPHVTVQNKVDSAVAKALNSQLKLQFEPFSGSIIGLNLWRYLHGPWQLVQTYLFCNQEKVS